MIASRAEAAARAVAQQKAQADADLEDRKAQNARTLEDHKAEHARRLEEAKAELARETDRRKSALDWKNSGAHAAIQLAQAALRGVVLLNGGAVIALLAFLSKDGAGPPAIAGRLAWPLLVFGAGAACGVIATFFGFLAQRYYAADRQSPGHRWTLLAFFIGFGGMVSFAVAAYCAARAFAS